MAIEAINWSAVGVAIAACSFFAGLIISAVSAIVDHKIKLVMAHIDAYAKRQDALVAEQAQIVERQRQTDLKLQDFYSRLHKCLNVGCETTAH